MSIPAGIDYTSKEIFAERYPAMLKYGLSRCYDTFGFRMPNKELSWGYMCTHGWYSTHFVPEDPTYTTLLSLVKEKPYFVATTNADGLFARTGFDKDRIWTPQGSYDTLQCKAGCGHVWSSLETIENVLAATPKKTLILNTDKCPIPTCPRCGGECAFNLNGGSYYINKHWEPQRRKLSQFVETALGRGKKVVIIEIGISLHNTPGVLRYPMEDLLSSSKQVSMVRINPDYPQLLEHYGSNVEPEHFVPLPMGAREAIVGIAERVRAASS